MLSKTVKCYIGKGKHYYLTVVLSLSLTMAMVFCAFSIIDTIYLKPLPYAQSEEIYVVEGLIDYEGSITEATNPPALLHLKNNSNLIDSMSMYFSLGTQKLYDLPARPEVPVFFTSPDFFKLIGVEPLLGRFFDDRERSGNRQTSVILSYKVWQEYFEKSTSIVNKKIVLDNKSYTVIGVTPDDWVIPEKPGAANGVWLPQDMSVYQVESFGGYSTYFAAFARLKSGVSLEEAEE